MKSEAMHREALLLRRSLFQGDHPDVADSLEKEATALIHSGRAKEGEPLIRECLAMRQRLHGEASWPVAGAVSQLARALLEQGRREEAEALFRENVARRTSLRGERTKEVASDLSGQAGCLANLGRFDVALPLHRRALEITREINGSVHPSTIISLNMYADALERSGDLKSAEAVLREALTAGRKLFPPGVNHRGWSERVLSNLLSAQGRDAELAELKSVAGKREDSAPPVASNQLTQNEPSSGTGTAISAVLSSAKPDDLILLLRLATVLAESGDLASYRELCHTTLERFSGTGDATTARRVAKASLLAPLPAADTEAAARLAEFGLANSAEPKFLVQAWLGKGLAEYRLGHFADVIAWMAKVTADLKTGSSIASQVNAAAHAVIASAQQRLAQTEKARTADAAGDLTANWQDTLIAQVFVREARQLIEGTPAAKAAKGP